MQILFVFIFSVTGINVSHLFFSICVTPTTLINTGFFIKKVRHVTLSQLAFLKNIFFKNFISLSATVRHLSHLAKKLNKYKALRCDIYTATTKKTTTCHTATIKKGAFLHPILFIFKNPASQFRIIRFNHFR